MKTYIDISIICHLPKQLQSKWSSGAGPPPGSCFHLDRFRDGTLRPTYHVLHTGYAYLWKQIGIPRLIGVKFYRGVARLIALHLRDI